MHAYQKHLAQLEFWNKRNRKIYQKQGKSSVQPMLPTGKFPHQPPTKENKTKETTQHIKSKQC